MLDHDVNVSHHEEVMHPNFENTMSKSTVQTDTKSWIRNLDKNKLKPFLLYKPTEGSHFPKKHEFAEGKFDVHFLR